MINKTEVVNLTRAGADFDKITRLQLDSGRQVLAHSNENGEFIEIAEAEGEIILKILMTENGPVISLEGAHLKLKATESIALEAKKVSIQATEKAELKSHGTLEIDASGKMHIRSEDDIRAVGKMIYLN